MHIYDHEYIHLYLYVYMCVYAYFYVYIHDEPICIICIHYFTYSWATYIGASPSCIGIFSWALLVPSPPRALPGFVPYLI